MLLLMLGLLFAMGCLRLDASEKDIDSSAEEAAQPALEMDFASRVSSIDLCAEGRVVLWGGRTLPYLLLNATFCNDGRPEKSIKYMMIEVDAKKEQPFKICKNARAPPGNYTCTLEAWGPEGLLGTETRACEVAQASFAPQEANAHEQLMPSRVDVILPAQEENPSTFPQESRPEEAQPAKGPEMDEMAQSSERIASNDKAPDDTAVTGGPMEGTEKSKGLLEGAAGEKTGLVGSSGSKKYHLPECRYAAKIRAENIVHFADEEEARKQGYQPCRVCFP